MFIGLAIGTFIGVLIGANLKSITKVSNGLAKVGLRWGCYALAVYGLVMVVSKMF